MVCTKCGEEKQESEFYKGHRCKQCCNAISRKYHREHREELKGRRVEYGRQYYLEHREEKLRRSKENYCKERLAADIVWLEADRARGRETRRKYLASHQDEVWAAAKKTRATDRYKQQKNRRGKERYATDLNFKLAANLRSRMGYALRRNVGAVKVARMIDLLGCTTEQLRYHLESRFDSNMNWENHGSYWHIDHIEPCASFDLTKGDQQRECFHWSNLQPLEAKANLQKYCGGRKKK